MFYDGITVTPQDTKDLLFGFIFIFVNFAGTLLVQDFPEQFKLLFSTMLGQFFVLFLTFLLISKDEQNVSYVHIALYACFGMLSLQMLKYIVKKFW